MTRRYGETSSAMNQREFPHLVDLALPPGGFSTHIVDFDAFHRAHGIPTRRGRGRTELERFFVRFCFSDGATADAFRDRFGGERLTYTKRRR